MNANLRMKNVIEEYNLLLAKYKELEESSKIPKVVYIEKEVRVEVNTPPRIGDKLERVQDLTIANLKPQISHLTLAVLFYHKQYSRLLKQYRSLERMYNTLNLDYLHRLYQIYLQMIDKVVFYLFRVFMNSKKLTVFVENLRFLKTQKDEVLFSILQVWHEFEDIFEICEFRDRKNEIEKCMPDHADDWDGEDDQLNIWVRDQFNAATERHKFERNNINSLYRLLEVFFRILHPKSGEDYVIYPRMLRKLKKEICLIASDYFFK